ncbi:MAG TPA: amino acid adenylation domain-containing protein, partial [Thermoanaerobaculia bacterium]|nr:amino acid adenylation domain-containing protein [Thermoanaerobaculia bacterium]
LAYVLYTSGSTGRPKGVEVPHAALANFLASMAEQPGLGADDVLLAVTSLSFDIAGLELYLPLVVGGRIELASREEAGDGARLLSRLRSSGATAMQATPSTWRMLIDAGWQGEPAIKVMCGGEALPEKLAAELCARSRSVWNLYGPTETTVWSAAGRVEAGEAVAIGPPIANTTLYVLGRRLEPAPVGVPGELFIGGDGVALGYRGRAELTAERFLPDPFGDRCGRRGRPGARLYRTGDLVRWRPRGELEFLGRIDHQVKVRGFRIELGEVEAALEAHPAVARAVVVAQATPEAGGGRLVAYLVATPAASPPVRQAHPVPAPQAPFQPPAVPPAELRAFTSAKLPEHMVPAAFIWLAALPLTPNGKVDRRALPTPEETGQAGLTDAFVAPRNPVEELLAGIWCELLDLRRVGIHDNFFELGGHSLTATRLLARVRAALGVEVPLRRLFEAPTVEGLARLTELLRRGGAAGAEAAEVGEAPPIAPAAGRHEGELPLSFAQQRVWILDQLGLAGTAYNLTLAMRLRGALDVAALAAALDRLVERHEALRTSFPSAHGRPRQQIAPRAHLPLPVTDLSALPPARRDTEARRVASRLARLSFDLARGPLLRAALLALAEGEHVVGLTVHHIVADGWSLGILVRDVASLYEAAHLARVIGRAGPYSRRASPSLPPLPQLAVQYADFAAWQRGWLSGEVLDAQLAYWRQQLTDLPPALPLLADRPRRAGRSEQAGRRWFLLPDELAQELRALSRRLQVTPFMVLLGGFAALLSRYTGEHDVAIGTPIANRARVELEPLIGFFANTLVLRSDLSGDPEFRTLLGRVRSTALDAYAHQDLPFERLVEELQPERDLGVNPLFQVMFQMQNVPVPRIDLAGLSLEPMEIERGAAMFDLVLSLTDQGSFLAGTFEHDAKLFAAPTIQRLAAHFTSLLAGAVADPERRIGELPLLSAAERHQLSVEWLDTRRAGQGEARVDQWIERQARARPEAAALCWLGGRMSYGELVAEAAGMARRLRARGLRPGEPVGVAVERSARLVPALLGIWQAGGAYLPMDPSYPEERLLYML